MADAEAAREREIKALERAAADVLRMKKDSRPKRPIIIEFCGSPKSGKTQAVTSLTIFLKRNGFNVRVLTERASISPVGDKRSPFFNVWTGASILTGLIPFLSEPVTDVDVVIADRGVFDTLCWFVWLQSEGAISDAESRVMTDFFMAKRFRQATDLVLAFTASSKASMEREYAHLLTRKYGSIMAPRVLQSYVRSVKKAIDDFGPSFKQVLEIDTSDLTQDQVAVRVTHQVLDSMRGELVEQVGGFRRALLEPFVAGQSVFPLTQLESTDLEIEFRQRSDAEPDNSFVQIVPIVVLADKATERVMVFRKRRETLGGQKSPERDRNLLYVGGHLRAEDSFGLSATEIAEIARITIEREMAEELGTILRVEPEDAFVIWDLNGQASSQKHLAIVYVARVNFEELKLRLDGYELVQPHNSDVSGKVVDAAEAASWPPSRLESWSRVILERIFGIELARSTELLDIDDLEATDQRPER